MRDNLSFDMLPAIEVMGDTVRRCTAVSDGTMWYFAEDIRRICKKPNGKFSSPCKRYSCGRWPMTQTMQLITFDALMRFVIKHSNIPLHVWTRALGDW